MKKKKVNVKTTKNFGKKSVKSPKKVVKRVGKVNKQSAVIIDTSRNFWGLFSNVKNHNFRSMMQKGNYLQDFIKLIEEMPEKQFQKVFIEPCDLNPQRIWQKIDCGCPEDTQCLCAKEKLVRNSNYYFDYLVECKLDRYEVEIQHLRYLIELQRKGTQVPSSYSMDEFLKRSGVPERPKTNSYADVVELIVEEENKDSKSLFEASSEDQKLKELFGGTSTEAKDEKKSTLEEILKKYTEKKKQDADKAVCPALKDLKNTTPKNLEKELEDLFRKRGEKSFNVAKDEDVCRLSEIVNDRLEEMNKIKQKEPIGSLALKSALQTIAGYANMLKENTPQVVTTEIPLPSFWQELKTARELFDKFDDFYAKKQVEAIVAARRVNLEKEKFLKLPENNDYRTSLQQDIKQYLKAERELKVLKKVLKAAYRDFAQVKTTQADPAYLAAEMSRYTSGPATSSNKFEGIFDHLIPNTEVYERAISRRPKELLFPLRHQLDKSKPKEAYVVESRTATEIVEGTPDLFTKEGRAQYRKQVAEKYETIKSFEQQKQVADDAWTYGIDSKGESKSALEPTYSETEEKLADQIQKYVVAGDVNPATDFDKLISYGMDKNSIECWKHKHMRGYIKNSEEGHMEPCSDEQWKALILKE